MTADFFNVTAWGKLGDFVCKYFKKGQQVVISGKLENRSWIDETGNKKYATDIVIEQAYFADGKKADASDVEGFNHVDMSDPEALPF